MPFLIPVVAGVIGAVQAAKQAGTQNKALTQQEQIAQQEMQDKQKIFDLLRPFFQQYLGAGSPFLSQIQRAGAERNAQEFGNAAGQVRNTMQTSGLGFGPSSATAAAIGEVGTQAAQNASSTYLNNLLNNEQLKFQAAQGLRDVGGMAGSPQNQPNVSVNLPPASTGSSIFGLSQVLQNLLKGIPGGGGGSVGSLPIGGYPGGPPGAPPLPIPTGAPTTSGIGFGPD